MRGGGSNSRLGVVERLHKGTRPLEQKATPMIHLPTRLRKIAVASLLGAGLAVTGIALPAQAAVNFGAVTFSSFTASQSAGVVTYDFDVAAIDPLAPGTVQISIDNYFACAAPTNVTTEYDVSAATHVQFSQSLVSNAYSSVTISYTDGTSMQFGQTLHVQDNAGAWGSAGVVVPDAGDPAAGYYQVQTGNERWVTHYRTEIDGVSGGSQTLPGCDIISVPFSALAAGSTLSVIDEDQGVVLASYLNPPPVIVPPQQPAAAVGADANTLPLTGFNGTPWAIGGAIALALGAGTVLWSIRLRRQLAQG